MNNKKRVQTFFLAKMPFLIVLYIFVTSLTFSVYNARFALRDNEKIQIFATTYGIKNNSFVNELLEELQDAGVMDVMLYDYSPATPRYYDFFTAQGLKSDFHIMPGAVLRDMQDVVNDYYVVLDANLKAMFINNGLDKYDFFTYDTNDIGLAIYKENEVAYNNNFTYADAFTFMSPNGESDDFYLLINRASLNIVGYNDKATTTHAFRAFAWLLERFANE